MEKTNYKYYICEILQSDKQTTFNYIGRDTVHYILTNIESAKRFATDEEAKTAAETYIYLYGDVNIDYTIVIKEFNCVSEQYHHITVKE